MILGDIFGLSAGLTKVEPLLSLFFNVWAGFISAVIDGDASPPVTEIELSAKGARLVGISAFGVLRETGRDLLDFEFILTGLEVIASGKDRSSI